MQRLSQCREDLGILGILEVFHCLLVKQTLRTTVQNKFIRMVSEYQVLICKATALKLQKTFQPISQILGTQFSTSVKT